MLRTFNSLSAKGYPIMHRSKQSHTRLPPSENGHSSWTAFILTVHFWVTKNLSSNLGHFHHKLAEQRDKITQKWGRPDTAAPTYGDLLGTPAVFPQAMVQRGDPAAAHPTFPAAIASPAVDGQRHLCGLH